MKHNIESNHPSKLIDMNALAAVIPQIGSVLAGRRVAVIGAPPLSDGLVPEASVRLTMLAKMIAQYARTVLVVVPTDEQYQDIRQQVRSDSSESPSSQMGRREVDGKKSTNTIRVVSTSRQSLADIGARGQVDIVLSIDSSISTDAIYLQKSTYAPLLSQLGYFILLGSIASADACRGLCLPSRPVKYCSLWRLNRFFGYSLESYNGSDGFLTPNVYDAQSSQPDFIDQDGVDTDHKQFPSGSGAPKRHVFDADLSLCIASDALKPPTLKHAIIRSRSASVSPSMFAEYQDQSSARVEESESGSQPEQPQLRSRRRSQPQSESPSRAKALSTPTMISARVRRATEQRLGWSSRSQRNTAQDSAIKADKQSTQIAATTGYSSQNIPEADDQHVGGLLSEQKSLILSLRQQLADVQSAQVVAKWTLDELKTQLIDLRAVPSNGDLDPAEPNQGYVKSDLVEQKTKEAKAAQEKLDGLQTEKTELEDKIDAIERKLMKSESRAMEAQRRATTAESKVAQLEIRLKRTKSEATALSKWAGELRGDLKDAKGESTIRPKTPEPEVNALKNDLSAANTRVKALEERCDRLRIQADQAQSLIRSLKQSTPSAAITDAGNDSVGAVKGSDLPSRLELKKKLDAALSDLATAKSEAEALRSELRDAEQSKAELITFRKEAKTLKTALDQADQEIRDLQTYSSGTRSAGDIVGADSAISDSNAQLIKAATLHTEEIARWRSQVDELQASLDHMRLERAQVRDKYMKTQREKIALEKKIESYRKESSQLGREVAKLQGELKKRQIMETDPNIESSTGDFSSLPSRPRIEI